MASFDFQPLKDALVPACVQAFREMRANHEGERFYCMALFTSGEFGYISPTAMTEEGLAAVVARYREDPAYSKETREDLQQSLRWSPCDSPLHLEGEEAFAAAQGVVREMSQALRGINTDDDWDEFDAFCDSIRDGLSDVLQEVDRQGVFGVGEEREQVFVAVMMGDQDESILDYGERLNPSATFERFQEQWEDQE